MVAFIDDIAGKRFLVTGASSGIGRETALELSRRGAALVIAGRDPDRLEETRSGLAGSDHTAVVGDLRESADIAALADSCGVLDGVVHAAGRHGIAPLKLLSEKMLDDVMTTNFKSVIFLTQRLLAKSRIKNGGSIVFFLSIAAHTGTKGAGPYSASKGALLGYMRAAALEVAPKKIRINGVSPAVVRTPIFGPEMQGWLDEQEKQYPLGLGRPEDVANAVVFLLSEASSYMTGTSIIMDGGCGWV
jgi:NAD(P)-dependent dehydrogenase (short-subunit alcohol dehydrogenase family)